MAKRRSAGYPPIEDHGVVGDLTTVALVGLDGSVDMMCYPDFDSPSVFAALLDAEKGGRFQVAPLYARPRAKQLYLPDSNMLLTRFLSHDGVVEVSDFMTVGPEWGGSHALVRRAKCVRGEARVRMVCEPRFDYARAPARVHRQDERSVLLESAGDDGLVLRLTSEVPLSTEGEGEVRAETALAADEHVTFVLEQAVDSGHEPLSVRPGFAVAAFQETYGFWHDWIGRCEYRGRWREMVRRSALALKLLFSRRHGTLVASPTFGLPEVVGGGRNWDYRYTWIRDSAFTIGALLRLGYDEEAHEFMGWLARCCCVEGAGGEVDALQVLYRLDGGREVEERSLDHLAGYRGSRPVRIGNDAYRQRQLDIYGELMEAAWEYGSGGPVLSYDTWTRLSGYVERVSREWHLADQGIWESRGEPQEFLHSRVMCWLALDRAVRLSVRHSLPAPLDRWRQIRDEVHRDVHERFWNPEVGERGAFVQRPGARQVDASCLLLPLVGFIAPRDPRWSATLRAVERQLVEDSLVHRYRTDGFDDGLEGKEGTFNVATFWYVQCLTREGDLVQARLVLEKMLGYANHLGLYGEELGLEGEHLGNFPQAFTHLALVDAATELDAALTARGERD